MGPPFLMCDPAVNERILLRRTVFQSHTGEQQEEHAEHHADMVQSREREEQTKIFVGMFISISAIAASPDLP